MTPPRALRSLACLLSLAAAALAAAASGCGPRTTFDRYDKLALLPVCYGPRVDLSMISATAEVPLAVAHYLVQGELLREVRLTTASADAHTVLAQPTILDYATDKDRPFGVIIGGRARGHATILWSFYDVTGTAIWEEEIRSIARDFDGVYTDLPAAQGSLDATAEGAGAYLLWWMRRAKSNPRSHEPPPVE